MFGVAYLFYFLVAVGWVEMSRATHETKTILGLVIISDITTQETL